jgi:hypothetical protein
MIYFRERGNGYAVVLFWRSPSTDILLGNADAGTVKRGIFISYRRSDEPAFAGRLYDRLGGVFGADLLFMDVDTIEYGLDFVQELDVALSQCRVLLAVIGRQWAAAVDEDGVARLMDPDDFVRVEIENGLIRPNVRVIPILVDGTPMPKAAELPDSLLPLRRRNACLMSHARFGADAIELIATVEKVLSATLPTKSNAKALNKPEVTRSIFVVYHRDRQSQPDTPGYLKPIFNQVIDSGYELEAYDVDWRPEPLISHDTMLLLVLDHFADPAVIRWALDVIPQAGRAVVLASREMPSLEELRSRHAVITADMESLSHGRKNEIHAVRVAIDLLTKP